MDHLKHSQEVPETLMNGADRDSSKAVSGKMKLSTTGLFIFSYFKSMVLKNCMLKGGLHMRASKGQGDLDGSA